MFVARTIVLRNGRSKIFYVVFLHYFSPIKLWAGCVKAPNESILGVGGYRVAKHGKGAPQIRVRVVMGRMLKDKEPIFLLNGYLRKFHSNKPKSALSSYCEYDEQFA